MGSTFRYRSIRQRPASANFFFAKKENPFEYDPLIYKTGFFLTPSTFKTACFCILGGFVTWHPGKLDLIV